MKKLIFIVLLMPILASAQTKGDRVYIIHPDKIIKNYTYTDEDEKALKKLVTKEELPAIKAHASPASWPRSIQAPTGFKMNADSIKKYVAYFVCNLPFGQSIIQVPVEGNEEMSEFLRPKKPFYFVISKDGITADEPEEKKK